jgi:hypothetical protein
MDLSKRAATVHLQRKDKSDDPLRPIEPRTMRWQSLPEQPYRLIPSA